MLNNILLEKIKLLTELTCWDHFKSRDLSYSIRIEIDPFNRKIKYRPYHEGYLWELSQNIAFESLQEAQEFFEEEINLQIEEELKWFQEEINSRLKDFLEGREDNSWGPFWPNSPVKSQEDLDKYKNIYINLKKEKGDNETSSR